MPSTTKPSSRRVAFLVAMPSAWPSEVAETSGAAARMSIAVAARESRRLSATARRAPMALENREQCQPVFGLLGEGVEQMPDPHLARPRRQCPGAGQQWAGE